MALKRYQERVLREVTIFLEALASQQAVGNARHAASDAWDEAKNQPYAWFTEGFDTGDLREAKALLDALGGVGADHRMT